MANRVFDACVWVFLIIVLLFVGTTFTFFFAYVGIQSTQVYGLYGADVTRFYGYVFIVLSTISGAGTIYCVLRTIAMGVDNCKTFKG